jgi:hypothetical protein
MNHVDRYRARADELRALAQNMHEGSRPAVIGQALEAAGDLLRREKALGVSIAHVMESLQKIPESSLSEWSSGVDLGALERRLHEAAAQAVESALPDDDADQPVFAQWALQGLQSRDKLASALEALGVLSQRGAPAAHVHETLRTQLELLDLRCRPLCLSFTALNPQRRLEALALDAPLSAWWFSDRSGIDDDGFVQALGGNSGRLNRIEKQVSQMVEQKRSRPVSAEELFRFDLGLSPAPDIEGALKSDPQWPALADALAADLQVDEVVPGFAEPNAGAPFRSSVGTEIVHEQRDLKVLVFRTQQRVAVVVQSVDRLATAAVWHSVNPSEPVAPQDGPLGQHFDLGPSSHARGTSARVVIRLKDATTQVQTSIASSRLVPVLVFEVPL